MAMEGIDGSVWLSGRHTQSVRGPFRYSTIWPAQSRLPIRHVYHLRIANAFWMRVPHLAWRLFAPKR